MTLANPTSTDGAWQQANACYLDRHLHRLRLYLNRRILLERWRVSGEEVALRQPDLDSTVIRDETVDRLLQPATPAEITDFYRDDPGAQSIEREIQTIELELMTRSQALSTSGSPAALDRLVLLFQLSRFEYDALLLAVAVGMDATFARLYGYVQDDVQLRQPTLNLAISLFCQDEQAMVAARRSFAPEAALRRYSLITFSATGYRTDERVIDYLLGINRLDERVAAVLHPVRSANAASHDELAAQVEQSLRTAASGPTRWNGVNLHGPAGSGRRGAALSLCARLGLQLFELDPAGLPPLGAERQELLRLLAREAVLSQIAPYFEVVDPNGPQRESALTDDLIQRMPVFFIAVSEARISTDRPLLSVLVPPLSTEAQRRSWDQALQLAGVSFNGELDPIIEQFRLPPEMITQAVNAAQLGAGADAMQPTHLWQACREQSAWQQTGLARRVTAVYTWDDIVLPEDARRQMREIAQQVRHRARVYTEWGFGDKLVRGRGVGALFAGVSGTGKTMAAEVLASELRLDLIRVDLAGMISKYIGETEKNLRQVFNTAERCGAILFFDEADALFGRRMDVKDHQDRFANIEINYLLQRMEDYRGLAILATNRKTDVDRAFLRRLRFLVDFAFPDASQRLQIWHKVFPKRTPLGDLDFEMLSRMEIAGGSIRNIALAAAFLAAEENRHVEMRHLAHATRREYAKTDKMISEIEFDRTPKRLAKR